jgi:cobyrinic acid a,c-diamide synthase
LRGGSGKTILSLGLAEAWRSRGLRVRPFKKGPDYIDAAWLTAAAGAPCRNLDAYMMGPEEVLQSFRRHGRGADVAVIEGNRGLFDGMDAEGAHSTAALAKLLQSPVIVVVDCTKSTRTVAALILGCRVFDPDVPLAGVVLNRVANARQEKLIRRVVEDRTDLKVLGAIPRFDEAGVLERHLGLLPPAEHPDARRALETVREIVENHVDVDGVKALAESAAPLAESELDEPPVVEAVGQTRIGVIRDSAFNFYYPENLEQLQEHGAVLVDIDSMREERLPRIDALYIGGGFPETHADRLAANVSFRESLRAGIEQGLPVYAECGGLIYLSEAIVDDQGAHPMVGIFPVKFELSPKPAAHGYAVVEVDRPNPFYETGTVLRGHEFRYSRALDYDPAALETVFRVERGVGFGDGRAGLRYKNVLATFCHVHALGVKCWAKALSQRALEFKAAASVKAAV